MSIPSFLTLARREFLAKLQTRHVIAILTVYVIISIAYGWYAYLNFRIALNPPPPPITFPGFTTPPANMFPLINLDNVYSIGALVALAISFDCLSSERQAKSLVLLSTLPISRSSIINGKLLGLFVLFLPVGTIIPVGAISISMLLASELSIQMLIRLFSLAGLVILYLALWIVFAVLVSSVTSKPSGSLAICFGLWIVNQLAFIGYLLPILVSWISFPGQVFQNLIQNPSFYSLNQSVARFIPPLSFLHAAYGEYAFTSFASMSHSSWPTSYILNSSASFASWLSFAWSDIATLLVTILAMLLVTCFVFSRRDIS